MNAQELFIYTPENGEWRKQSGNVAAARGEVESYPGVARDARLLVVKLSPPIKLQVKK